MLNSATAVLPTSLFLLRLLPSASMLVSSKDDLVADTDVWTPFSSTVWANVCLDGGEEFR